MSPQTKSHLISILCVILIVLIGYHKIFFGANFFTYEDTVVSSNFTYGNSLGNGWRSDKGLGVSFFFGDVGIWHPWGIFSLLERVAPSREWAYGFSIVLLDILAAMAQYFFLYTILGREQRWVAVLLAPLIVFGSDQAGQHFTRMHISQLVAIPLYLLLLDRYYAQPTWCHLFLATLLFLFVPFMGNMWSLTQLLSLGFIFSVLYFLYYKPSIFKFLQRYLMLHVFALVMVLSLGAWCFYSFFWEKHLLDYIRVKPSTVPEGFSIWPNIQNVVNYLIGLLQAEWVPFYSNLAGINSRPFVYTFNVAVAFPLIFLFFLFRRSKSFWEFALKWCSIIFVIHQGLTRGTLWPWYGQWFSYLSSQTSKIITMYELVFPLQIGLMAIFISLLKQGRANILNIWGRALQIFISTLFTILYTGFFVLTLFVLFWPKALIAIVATLVRWFSSVHIVSYPRELLEMVLVYNIERFKDVAGWPTLLFYLSSLSVVFIFLRNKWINKLAKWPVVCIALLFCVNNVSLSWAIFPLSEEKLFWKREPQHSFVFEPTDRFYYVNINQAERTLESFKREWSELEGGGPREREAGLIVEPPALNLSGLVSFHSRLNGEFLYHVFNGQGSHRINELRKLARGGPLFTSPLLDMCAVNYYFSNYPLVEVPANLVLYRKAKQLYIYKNLTAWPYFYLAKRVRGLKNGEHLRDVQRDTAYVLEKDNVALSQKAGKGRVKLKSFSYGYMIFDYDSLQEEFLVVADAWHPFWKAKVEGWELPVLRVNEVFKGVRLPPGQHEFRLFFDPSPYKVGIHISIVSWILFVVGFIWAFRTKTEWRF